MADSSASGHGISRRMTLHLFLFYIISYFFFFFRSAFTFPIDSVLHKFLWTWIFSSSIHNFIQNLTSVHLSAVLVFYSLIFSFGKKTIGQTTPSFFHHVVTSAIAIILIASAFFAILTEGIGPFSSSKMDEVKQKTALAKGLFNDALKLKEEEKYKDSRIAMDKYLSINPEDTAAMDLDKDLIELYSNQLLTERENIAVSPAEKKKTLGMTPKEMTAKARELLDRGDYYTSHYYSSLAAAVDPGNKEAKALLARSFSKIAGTTLIEGEVERSRLFKRKQEAFSVLQKGNVVDAFYLFLRLSREYPEDPDAQNYLEITRTRLKNISFFKEEIEDILHLPGPGNILFVNDKNDDSVELVFIEQIHQAREGSFLENIEAVRLSEDYKIIYHLTARYGKITDSLINMYCIDQEDPKNNLQPVYLSGSRPDEIKNIIKLNIPEEDLSRLNISGLKKINLLDLWRLSNLVPDFGYRSEPYRIAFFLRILEVFSFLVLSLFAVTAGWALRPNSEKPPVLSLIFIPLFPMALRYLTSLYSYGNEVLTGFLYLLSGPVVTAVALLIIQFFLISTALILLSGQTIRKPDLE